MKIKNVVMCVSLALFLFACNEHESQHESKNDHGVHGGTPKLTVTNPQRKDMSITKEYVAQIHAYRHIELRALEGGYLQDIFVDEGQEVEKDQKMFKIMPTLYEIELQKAQAEANVINIEYDNAKALAKKNVISQNELAVAKAKLQKAFVEIKLAEMRLGFTDINAPFNGIMDHLDVRTGSLLEEGELLTTLSDINKMWVYFNVPESEYLDYKNHKSKSNLDTVKLKMANGEIFNHEGKIETIEADFDNTTGNIEFRATFINPEQLLRHGQTGTVLIEEPHEDALVIPQRATFEILDKTYVYVVDEDGKLQQRPITIDAELPHLFLVKQGLNESDKILVEGLRKVRNGQEIIPEFIPAIDVLSDLELHAE